MNNTKNFVNHRDGLHDPDGFQLSGGQGLCEESIVNAGGSLENFRQFLEVAKESATMVESSEKALELIIQKRKATSKHKSSTPAANIKPPKLTRTEMIDKKEKDEIEDENGLEKDYKGCFMGCAHIPLANISVCKEMDVKINPFRVQFVMSSIQKRYDPSLSVLVVCPVDESSNCDKNHVGFLSRTHPHQNV